MQAPAGAVGNPYDGPPSDRAGPSTHETIVPEAFNDLLKAWGRAQDLMFVAEYR